MKRFIDEKGTFELKVPTTWKHSVIDNKVHTFQEYEIWKSDIFQLSINLLDTEEKKKNLLDLTKSLSVEKIGNFNFYKFPDSIYKEITTKAWIKKFDDKSVIFSLTHSKKIDFRTITEKVKIVHSILKEFKFIESINSENMINSYRFDMFLQGVGATSLILSKAIENKAFIEATCLLANQIDALLRIGIILKNQIINSNSEIEVEWIYQGLKDKKKSEKEIYKKALTLGIIDQTKYDNLYDLYDDRNRVIHRFIISEITLAEVEEIAYKYHLKQQIITKVIYDLESEQIRLNIGMTKIDNTKKSDKNYTDYIKGKIGKQNYFDDKLNFNDI